MRNLKKFLALVLAMMMVMSLMMTADAAAAKPKNFDDLSKVTPAYAEAVNVLSALKVVQGDDDGGFRPGDTINRAEVAAMIYRIATADTSDTGKDVYKIYDLFDDVNENDWFAGYVNYCGNAQYIKGVDPWLFLMGLALMLLAWRKWALAASSWILAGLRSKM